MNVEACSERVRGEDVGCGEGWDSEEGRMKDEEEFDSEVIHPRHWLLDRGCKTWWRWVCVGDGIRFGGDIYSIPLYRASLASLPCFRSAFWFFLFTALQVTLHAHAYEYG